MGKLFLNLSKKVIALSLVLVLLFNTGGEGFASLINTPLIGQEELLFEIREALEKAKVEEDSDIKNYKACIENKSEEKCKAYVTGIREQFQKSTQESQRATTEDKQSYKAFEAAYKKAIEKEYKKGEEEIRKNILSGWLFSELTWENMNRLNYLESQSKEELLNWKKSEEKKIKGLYAQYEKDYEAWKAKVEKEEEEAGRTYLKEVSKRLIKAYNTTQSESLKREIRKLIVALLTSEGKAGDFVEWRTSAETILIDGLANKPCDFKGGPTPVPAGPDRYIGYDRPGVYPPQNEVNWKILPFEYKDEARCQEAYMMLDGLSYLERSDKGIKAVRTFMRENHQGLAAADSLIEGMAVLLKWKAYNNINEYIAGEMKTENEGKDTGIGGFGGISEEIAYNGNYLGAVSSYSQRADGTNAWEDLAHLLAEEGSTESQNILRTSVSSCKVVHVVIGRDKLDCKTILPFLYGALLHAPKTMDTAKPYQEPIPVGKEYLDAQGRIHPTNRDRVLQDNQWRVKDFKEKLSEYGNTLSKGLAGFIYYLKFADLPVDAKMKLDNKLAEVYKHLIPYKVGSNRYIRLSQGRAVVAIFKALGIVFDVWCFVSLAGIGVKAFTGTQALIKARKILSGASALSAMQRANILRQITFIRHGAQLRRFGRNTMKFVVNSGNIGRKINATAYLAEKNGMNIISYMWHNKAYNSGKRIAAATNILRVEGVESIEFFKNSHYIASKHKDIFRINSDIKRAAQIGVRELGEGGQVVSYIDKAKLRIFKDYTNDYLKGAGKVGAEGSGATQSKTLMQGETTLLPRDFLYSRGYKKILPFAQETNFAKSFNLGDKVYEALRGEGLYVYNTQTGKIFNDFSFHFEGYLNKKGLLGGLITPSKKMARSNVANFAERTQTAINGDKNLMGALSLAKNNLFLQPLKPVTISMPNNATGVWGLTKTFVPKLSKVAVVSTFTKELSDILPLFSINKIENKKPDSYEGTVKNINNILEKPISGKKNTVVFSLDLDKKEKIFDILAGKIFEVSSEKALTETQKNALDTILKNAVSTINERTVFMSEDLLDIINKFYANVEWISSENPILTVDSYEATDSFFGWFSPNGVSVKGIPYNKKDFYDKFDGIIKTLAQNHKEFNIILRFHGSYNGRIQITEKLESNIPTILARIKENAGTSKVNIITTACFGQSTKDFTQQVIKYGFNYIGFSSVNNIMFSGRLFNRIATTITDFPQTFLNAISVGYLGSVLVYEGKVYRALDIAKEFYKDNPAVSAQVKYLQELFFGRNPIDAMMKLGKQKGYTLTLFNSEEDLELLNGFKPLTFEEIKKQVNRDRARYNVRKFTEAFFTDRLILPNGGIWLPRFFKTLTNDIQIGAHQFLIELKNGKVLGLSGPTAKMKKDVLKSVQETFRNEGIPFSQPTEVIKESKKTTSGSLQQLPK